jgi:hypothetical protein
MVMQGGAKRGCALAHPFMSAKVSGHEIEHHQLRAMFGRARLDLR